MSDSLEDSHSPSAPTSSLYNGLDAHDSVIYTRPSLPNQLLIPTPESLTDISSQPGITSASTLPVHTPETQPFAPNVFDDTQPANSNYTIPWLFMDPFYPSLYSESNMEVSPMLSDSPGSVMGFTSPSFASPSSLVSPELSDYETMGNPYHFGDQLNAYRLGSPSYPTLGSIDEKKATLDHYSTQVIHPNVHDNSYESGLKAPSKRTSSTRRKSQLSRPSGMTPLLSKKRASVDSMKYSEEGDTEHRQPSHPIFSTNTIIEFLENEQVVTSERNLGIRPRKSQGSSGKEMKEVEGICKKCNIKFAVLILHGTAEAIDSNYTIQVECQNCLETHKSAESSPRMEDVSKVKLKTAGAKRSHRSSGDDVLECDCCRRWVGQIDIKLWDTGSIAGGASIDMHQTGKSRQSSGLEFGVEVVCEACANKYGLCTECGGGRKFRTGKWRPLGLFLPERRTCMLPHSRIGKPEVRYETRLLRSEFNTTNVEGEGVYNQGLENETYLCTLARSMEVLYHECMVGMYAVPKFMEAVPGLETWPQLRDRVRDSWKECYKLLKSDPVPHKRYYLTLALADSLPPRKVRKRSTADLQPSVPLFNKQAIVGFMLGDWDLKKETFCFLHSCQKAISNEPRYIALAMSRDLMKRAIQDSFMALEQKKLSPSASPYSGRISHVFAFTARMLPINQSGSDTASVASAGDAEESFFSQSLYLRAGFLKVEDYVAKHQVDPSIFQDVPTFVGGTGKESYGIYVGSIESVIKNLDKNLFKG